MFEPEEKDLSIHINRGDIGTLTIRAKKKDGSFYTFQEEDIIRLGVYKKGNFKMMVLKKDITVEDATSSVDIPLTKEDTTIGGIINKPVDYWYEIQLNPDTNPQTIIGYDKKGAKIFRLYPEGVDIK